MGISAATLELLVNLKDNASAGLGSITSTLGTLGTAGLAVAAAGVAALGSAIVGGVGDAREAQQLYAATENIIKNTGAAAGISAQQVVDLASSLSDAAGKSLFGDDQIQGATNVLLKYKELKGLVPGVTQLAVDMAQTLGTDPAAAAEMLGRALQKPFDASAKLAKQGIILTESQTATLAALEKTGDTAGAQAFLMEQLNSTYAGSAQSAATAAGGMVQFQASLGETFETIGSKLLPILDQLGAWLASPDVQGAIATFADALANGIGVAAAYLSDTAIPALTQAWTNMQPSIAATADFITGTLIPALAAVWAYIQANVIPILIEVAAWLATNIPPAIQAAAGFITGTLIPALAAVWAYIQANVIPILATVVTWLRDNVPPAMAAVSTFITGTLIPAFSAVWAFLQTNVIPILSAVANVAIALVMVQVRLLAQLWTGTLQPALENVWAFIDQNIMPILSSLASFIGATLGPALSGLGETISPIAGWFGSIGSAVSGVIDWLSRLADALNSISIPDWVEGHSPPPLANWLSSIAGAAKDATAAMGDVALPSVSLPGVASSGVGANGGAALATGGQIVRIAFDAGEFRKFITATIEQALTDSGGRSLSRIRTGN